MKYLREYAGRMKKYEAAFLLCCLTAGCVAFLYNLPAEPVDLRGSFMYADYASFFLGRIPKICKTKRKPSADFK